MKSEWNSKTISLGFDSHFIQENKRSLTLRTKTHYNQLTVCDEEKSSKKSENVINPRHGYGNSGRAALHAWLGMGVKGVWVRGVTG